MPSGCLAYPEGNMKPTEPELNSRAARRRRRPIGAQRTSGGVGAHTGPVLAGLGDRCNKGGEKLQRERGVRLEMAEAKDDLFRSYVRERIGDAFTQRFVYLRFLIGHVSVLYVCVCVSVC